jgi:hypothetical protein
MKPLAWSRHRCGDRVVVVHNEKGARRKEGTDGKVDLQNVT